MIDQSPRIHGLSGDLGWNDADDAPMGVLRSALLLAATGAYFGAVWLMSGLPPLPSVASRVRGGCQVDAEFDSTSKRVETASVHEHS
jgi:hypothetical protein